MQLLDFIELSGFEKSNELERATLLMYYHLKIDNIEQFIMNDILKYFSEFGCSKPNISRLRSNMKSSKRFIMDLKCETIQFNALTLAKLNKEFSETFDDNESISSNSQFLNEDLFCGHRGYLDKLVYQINNTYSSNCYDACAVLLRRMLEILLILSFKNNCIDSLIMNGDGTYFMLERIVSITKNNQKLSISRIKNEYDALRNLGNFSAHRIEYNASKHDLDSHKQSYRVAFEELLYKSGFKN